MNTLFFCSGPPSDWLVHLSNRLCFSSLLLSFFFSSVCLNSMVVGQWRKGQGWSLATKKTWVCGR